MSRSWTAIRWRSPTARLDPVIPVDWGREARDLLVAAGADVAYHESLVPHTIDPEIIPALRGFLAGVLDAK